MTDAYRLPKGSADEAAQRSAVIAAAVLGAARPPAAVVGAAGSVLDLAEALLPIGNPNVVSDIAAAAEAARAAATTARVNIEINLGGDHGRRRPRRAARPCPGRWTSSRSAPTS